MTIVRFARAAAIAAAGAFATAGAVSAAPALGLDTGNTAPARSAATPVYYGYGPYGYNGYYAPPPPPRPYYRPYYNPYQPYYGNPGYYQPYGYRGYGYSRPKSGLYIRTPGLRLGIGF